MSRKRAPRTLDVRLQQEHGLAVAVLFLQPVVEDGRHQPAGTPVHVAAKLAHEAGEKRLRCRPSSRDSTSEVQIDRIAAGQPAGLLGRADAMAEDQAGVEHVAQQPLGQRGDRGRRRRGSCRIIRSTSL